MSSPLRHVAKVDLTSEASAQRMPLARKGAGERVLRGIGQVAFFSSFFFFPVLAVSTLVVVAVATKGRLKGPSLPLSLAARPDEAAIYAYSPDAQSVSVIDLKSGQITKNIGIGGGFRRLLVAPGDRYVLVCGDTRLTWIDTKSDLKAQEFEIKSGKLNGVYADEANRRVIALTSDSLLVWDSTKAELVNTVKGFSEPCSYLDPQAIDSTSSR